MSMNMKHVNMDNPPLLVDLENKEETFRAMGTSVTVNAFYQKTIEDVKQFFAEQEARFSRFLPDSELSNLNRHAGESIFVSAEMEEVLNRANDYRVMTHRWFDPVILPALLNEGYGDTIEAIRGQSLTHSHYSPKPAQKRGYEQVGRRLFRIHSSIDLSGIVKGWTVTKAIDRMPSTHAGMINAGGDLQLKGIWQRPLKVEIEHPFKTKRLTTIRLRQGALATSSTQKRSWSVNDKKAHHLIDPFAGTSSTSGIAQVTALAETAEMADIAAKVRLLAGNEYMGLPFPVRFTIMNDHQEWWEEESPWKS